MYSCLYVCVLSQHWYHTYPETAVINERGVESENDYGIPFSTPTYLCHPYSNLILEATLNFSIDIDWHVIGFIN